MTMLKNIDIQEAWVKQGEDKDFSPVAPTSFLVVTGMHSLAQNNRQVFKEVLESPQTADSINVMKCHSFIPPEYCMGAMSYKSTDCLSQAIPNLGHSAQNTV